MSQEKKKHSHQNSDNASKQMKKSVGWKQNPKNTTAKTEIGEKENGIASNNNNNNNHEGTRICLKNIPIQFTEEKLKNHLKSSSKMNLVITDCKILKTKDGKSRKLAFVGFKDAEMAKYSVNHFNKTYAGTSKLHVDFAFAKKEYDPSVYRPWSKYSEGSSRNAALTSTKKSLSMDQKRDVPSEKKDDVKTKMIDQKKEEFLAAMGVGSKKSSFWSNDDGLITQNNESDILQAQSKDGNEVSESDSDSRDSIIDQQPLDTQPGEKKKNPDDNDDDDMAFLRSKVISKENLLSDSEDDDSSNDTDGNETENSKSDSESSSSSSNDDDSDSDDDIEPSINSENSNKLKKTPKNEGEKQELTNANNSHLSPTRLFIRNLCFETTESELKELFDEFGKVIECHIPIDDYKKRKGYAFIRFASKESATKAKEALDKTDFQGRIIHILPAKKAPHEIKAEEEEEIAANTDSKNNSARSQTYKSQKEEERQRNAPNDTTGWNASILRTDAVVDNLSSRLDIAKSDILISDSKSIGGDKSSTSAAVRLALGETHVLQENKEYFAKHGFDMEGLITKDDATKQKRSLTQILVKNLPYNGNQNEQLHKLFANHHVQPPKQMLIPPSKTVALLEYEHPTEARSVFRKLAYKRFQHVPLYLEWAPLAALQVKEEDQTKDNINETGNDEESKNTLDRNHNCVHDDDDDIQMDSFSINQSIFVKNLNFATTEDELFNHFTSAGISVRAVKIPTKVTTSSKLLSMGYGFVECVSSEEAKKALRKLKNTMLAGHSLQLSISSKQLSSSTSKNIMNSSSKKKRKKLPTKIAVKNLPFQASKSEITSLFGTFGQIKTFRLPKKFGSAQHRGFGFVEFVTGQEAANAFDNLSRSHLYGRKLVLEWAEVDENQMTTNHENNDTTPKPKKIRFT